MACRLESQGEQVKLLVAFNGPSPAWIKRWRWYGTQPTWQAKYGRPERPTEGLRVRRRKAFRRRLIGVLRDPRKLTSVLREPRKYYNQLSWYFWKPQVRIALALGRPIPESLREHYFLVLHMRAERAYQAGRFGGEMVTFYGQDLYEDPAIGWSPHARSIRSFAVPGEHKGNRDAMREPAVEFVARDLSAYLAEVG